MNLSPSRRSPSAIAWARQLKTSYGQPPVVGRPPSIVARTKISTFGYPSLSVAYQLDLQVRLIVF